MARTIWHGHLTFGLLEIPVSLSKVEEPRERLRFTLVDRRDHAPVGNLRVNKRTGEAVPNEALARGFPLDSGEYVLLSSSELEQANPEATHTVEIVEAVDRAEIHPVFFDTPYFLAPDGEAAQKAYALLREALARTEKAAIARVVIRSRQYVAALVPFGPALVLALLRYARELRAPESLPVPSEDLTGIDASVEELRMAERLVEAMATEWRPERYRDDYFHDVMALIGRKVAEGETEPAEEAPPQPPEKAPPRLQDLSPLLRESVERRASGRRS